MVWSTLEALLFDPVIIERIRSALPEGIIPLFEYVTHLGDPAFLLAVAVGFVLLENDRHRDCAVIVLGVTLLAFAVTNVLKGVFVLERPVESLVFATDEYAGYSFPSGHSLGAAATYGAIAVFSERGSRLGRVTMASTLVGLVAFSRVVLGVHYPGDVIGGVLVGLLLIVALVGVLERFDLDPGLLFGIAAGLGIVSYVGPSRAFMPATVGGAIGATFAWLLLKGGFAQAWAVPNGSYLPDVKRPSTRALAIVALLVVPLFVTFRIASMTVDSGLPSALLGSIEFASYAVGTVLAILGWQVGNRIDTAWRWLSSTS